MIRVTYVGHATVLIEIGGVRLLTDPVLRQRLGHVRRVVAPAENDVAKNLDAVLVSHAHHDHLDVPSLRAIDTSGKAPRVLCPAPAAGPVSSVGLEPEVLTPGGHADVGAVGIEVTAAEHDGRRWPVPGGDPEAIGFVLRDPDSGSTMYFAGDTGPFDGIAEIGPVDLALMPVAGWGPRLGPGHLDPEQAAEATVALKAKVAVPIHWGTYQRVLMKGVDREAPPRRFAAKLEELDPGIRAEILEPGESLEL